MAVTFKKAAYQLQIFKFGPAGSEGSKDLKDLLGGKGANLCHMANSGVPVPPGFTIPCPVSLDFKHNSDTAPKMAAFYKGLWGAVADGCAFLSESAGYMPLVSVRSGARVSMPGMMDTILNVGLTTETLPLWVERIGERAALDSYRRLIQMYATVALDIPMEGFDELLADIKKQCGAEHDSDLDVPTLKSLVASYKELVADHGQEFPDTLEDQLRGAVLAVFRSWDNPRAVDYRAIHGIPETWGTAVTVQSMVFGNMSDASATGVLFTRDPSTGENVITGEFLVNAQGEDVVAGIRTPSPLSGMAAWNPQVLNELVDQVTSLETLYQDMQDVEFTVQDGKLYILQTRNGKRAARAAFKVAHDLAEEGLISWDEAAGRVSAAELNVLLRDTIAPGFTTPENTKGLAGGGGIASGVAVFSAKAALASTKPCILVSTETNPDDIKGMNASVGILTATGGMTSHAAVVARGMNKSCVVGCTSMAVNKPQGMAYISGDNNVSFEEGALITIDGATGRVWVTTPVPVVAGGLTPEASRVLAHKIVKSGSAVRVSLSPSMSSEEMLAQMDYPEATPLHIDTCVLELSGPNLGAYTLLGSAIASAPSTSVVLDMRPARTLWEGSCDVSALSMFGMANASGDTITARLDRLLLWPKEAAAKVTLQFGDIAIASHMRTALTARGFRIAGAVTTVESLLNATGPMTASTTVVLDVFGSEAAYLAVREWASQKNGVALGDQLRKPAYPCMH